MSRAIKFRAWYKDGYIKQISFKNEENMYFSPYNLFLIKPEIRRDVVLEQCTGLKDKNGKEIYEGDIVSCYSLSGEYGALFVVKYGELPDIRGHEYCPCLQGFYLDEIDEYEEVDEDGYMEVIGNIHENPELLGGEE